MYTCNLYIVIMDVTRCGLSGFFCCFDSLTIRNGCGKPERNIENDMGNSWFLHELICIHDGSWWNVRMNGEFTDTLNILEPNFDRHITHHDHHDRVVLTEAH